MAGTGIGMGQVGRGVGGTKAGEVGGIEVGVRGGDSLRVGLGAILGGLVGQCRGHGVEGRRTGEVNGVMVVQ